MRNIIAFASIAGIAAVLALTACGSTDQPETKSDNVNVVVTDAPASLLTVLTTKPEAAIDVVAARAKAPGSAVTIKGRIGGRAEPFIAERSAFLLADLEAIKACDANPDDHCTTPWDYCCESKTLVATSTCLVQVVDGSGKVATTSLNGVGGMVPGSTIVITGTVSPQSTPESPIIIAQAVYVEPAPAKKE
jgi:hypothetical protein